MITPNSDNRHRAFAEVVSIDAWHEEFEENQKVDLHADVVFNTARVGGESDSPVRFRLKLRRAEIVVVIPESEPVDVDKRSVSRDSPSLTGTVTNSVVQSTQLGASGSLHANLSASGAGVGAAFKADGSIEHQSDRKFELSGEIALMSVTQSKTADGCYRWVVEPTDGRFLEGRPWDASKAPRLKLVDRRKDRSKGIPPTVRVEVRCRREDLDIEDITLKDESLWENVKGRLGFANKLAAAESYIRDRLLEEGLEVRNFGDLFGQVTLASTTAEPSAG